MPDLKSTLSQDICMDVKSVITFKEENIENNMRSYHKLNKNYEVVSYKKQRKRKRMQTTDHDNIL